MTRQRPDAISVDGDPGWIHRARPLASVVRRGGIPRGFASSTAVAGGYTAEWSVCEEQLCLDAILQPVGEVWPAAMTRLFGGRQPPIPASWYSGRLVVRFAEPLGASWRGPASAVELELLIERGRVASKRRYEAGRWLQFWRVISR